MPGRFVGKVVLVTGGGSGIGRSLVESFVAEGARVCAVDLSSDRLAALASDLGEDVATVVGDVRDPETHDQAAEAVRRELGGLDILVGNAGIFDGYARLSDVDGKSLSDAFDEIFEVNVKGYFLAARACADMLVASRGSMVFTVSSSAFHSETGGSLYASSKAAVVGLIRQLAFELAPDVRVNGVSPGGTQTQLQIAPTLRDLPTAARKSAGSPEERAERAKRRSPLGRPAVPEDLVPAYLFLASDEARLMTGAVVQCDGGLAARGIEQVAGSTRR